MWVSGDMNSEPSIWFLEKFLSCSRDNCVELPFFNMKTSIAMFEQCINLFHTYFYFTQTCLWFEFRLMVLNQGNAEQLSFFRKCILRLFCLTRWSLLQLILLSYLVKSSFSSLLTGIARRPPGKMSAHASSASLALDNSSQFTLNPIRTSPLQQLILYYCPHVILDTIFDVQHGFRIVEVEGRHPLTVLHIQQYYGKEQCYYNPTASCLHYHSGVVR